VNTFDRHLLREWLQILGLCLAATCGLLFVQISYDEFHNLREEGARGMDLLRYLVVTMPSFLAIVLLTALLVSLLFTLTKLHRSNELTAMRAAGVGFLRLMAPVWAVGMLACGLAWWLNSVVVPWSVEQSRALGEELEYRSQSKVMRPDRVGALYDVAFDNPGDRRMWFFNRYSNFTHRGYGISVSQLDPQRREFSRLVASEGQFDDGRRGWTFKTGRELLFDVETGEQMASTPFAEKFEPGFHEDPQLMLLTTARPSDLSFFELDRLVNYFAVANKAKGVAYAVRYYGLIADTLGPLIVIAIALPLAVAGVRVNPAVGVSKAIGLFFLYYVMMNVAAILATKQVVDPEIAAWLPNIGMAGLAAWFFARLR
jgi:lipopolysaccharide export system permease protein